MLLVVHYAFEKTSRNLNGVRVFVPALAYLGYCLTTLVGTELLVTRLLCL